MFGVLLNFGVGNYAPTLVMFSLMGMDPRLSFPIMAAGAAVIGAGAERPPYPDSARIDFGSSSASPSAASPRCSSPLLIVKTMPLEMLRWLVIVVVLYAAAIMLRAASPRPAFGHAYP